MTETHKDNCTCQECGRNLYSEENIKQETRFIMDGLLNAMDTECTGRTMFVIVIGDNGDVFAKSPALEIPDDKNNPVLKAALQKMIKGMGRP